MYHPLSTPKSPMFTNNKDIVLTYIQEQDEVPLEYSYEYSKMNMKTKIKLKMSLYQNVGN
jgi:hypothetical protein